MLRRISILACATNLKANSFLWDPRHSSNLGARRYLSNPANSQPMRQFVQAEVTNGVATITLKVEQFCTTTFVLSSSSSNDYQTQDDKKRNALSSGLMKELLDSISQFESDSKVKVVVIRNDGKVFSSGHDLKEIQTLQKVSGTTGAVFSLCSSLMLKVM